MNEGFATAAARRFEGVDGASALARFFRYHGIWAPGVRLFRAIGFRAKALTITAVFLLPIAWLSYNYFTDKSAAIGFSAAERVGVAYARAALPLLSALHQQRMVAVQEAASGQPVPGADAARAAVQAALKPLAEAQARLGAELQTGPAHAEMLKLLQSLPPASAGVESVLAAHGQLINAQLVLLTTATDNSNLTLDPDLDTYYLMDGSLGALPALLEAVAQHRDIALAMLAGHSASNELTKQLGAQEVIGDLTDARWASGVAKVKTQHPAIEAELQSVAANKAVHSFHDIAGASASAPRLTAAAEAALQALRVAQDQSLGKLDTLLQARIGRLEAARLATAGALALSLLLVGYLFLSFRKVLEGGLQEVAFHINAMRDGDLTTSPRAWGNDEAAGLMHTLAEMQASLRKIVSQVRGASSNIVVASTQIAGGAMDLSARTEASAANLQQTAAAMEEVSATVARGGDTVRQATELAVSNAAAAERGGAVVAQVVQTMQGINVASGRIGDIIGTIDGIAFQTNILALNAAVEAARAGEQGRGFAVVASEVRALAQRSGAAAREIKTLITASVEQVEGGVRVVREAGQTMNELQGSARRVRELLEAVSLGAREQSQGVTQSAQAVQALDQVTQQNAALVEETAAAAGSLKDQAEALAAGVAQFTLPAHA